MRLRAAGAWMNRHDRVRGVVFAAEHLLGFRRLDLGVEGLQRALEVRNDGFTRFRPVDQHADIVDPFGEAVAQRDVIGEAPLALQRLLRLGRVVPEVGRSDLPLELGYLPRIVRVVKDSSACRRPA